MIVRVLSPLNGADPAMRALILGLLIVPLFGCSSEAEKAERQYAIVKGDRGASASDICAAGRAVAAAYLKAENASKYGEAKLRADIECQAATLNDGR